MSDFLSANNSANESAPGSLIFVGDRKMEEPVIEILQYTERRLNENTLENIEQIKDHIDQRYINWVNVFGLHDTSIIQYIGEEYELDSLLLEDILDTRQRPKFEQYGSQLFIVLRMIRYDPVNDVNVSEQFSLVLSKNKLFTFQEIHGDILEGVRNRIRKRKTRIRSRSIDYLAYALIDVIVDNYIFSIEKLGEKILEIDQEILQNPRKELLEKINDYKRQVNFLRKTIRPVKELIFQLKKSEFMDKKNRPFLSDLSDHVTHAIEAIETYRELLSDQLNIYHTSMSNKLNEIIRLLTIYSVIFIPLTFLAGIYGMNFKYFPELEYEYAYPIFWGVLVLISISMVLFFKKKGWL
ncbi:MAG: magnesium/cobalt transporter CorA [Cyclobacteriaceae bacterium]